MRRTGQKESFGWQTRKLGELVKAKRGRYVAGTTIVMDRVKALQGVDALSGDPRIRSCEHDAAAWGDDRLLENLFGGNDLSEDAICDAHKTPSEVPFCEELDAINARDRETREKQPAADVAFPCVSRVANSGFLRVLATYARETGAKVYDLSAYRALMFEDVGDVDEERRRLREFLLDDDGALNITDSRVEGFLTLLAVQALNWRYSTAVVRPFWSRVD